MILIADSGATTTTWCAMDRGTVCAQFESEGYNKGVKLNTSPLFLLP